MTIHEKIRMTLAYLGMTEAELARRLEMSPQALNQKLKRGKMSIEDLQRIGEAMGADFYFGFRFKDGPEI